MKRGEPLVKLHCEHTDSIKGKKWIRDTRVGKECIKCYSFLEE